MRRAAAVGAALVALALGRCRFADDPTGVGSPPGLAIVALVTPNDDDGAALLTLTGPTVPTLSPADPNFRIFSRQVAPGTLRVIAVGDLRNGALLTFQVSDVGTLGEYDATVESVASRTDELRADLGGYGTNITGAAAVSAR